MMRALPILAFGALAATVSAQKPLTAASFMPDEPQAAYCIDLARMREREVWDELEHTLLSTVLRQMEKELGFPLSGLDRMQCWMHVAAGAEPQHPQPKEMERTLVWEGRVGLPPAVNGPGWSSEQIGEHAVKLHGDRQEVYVRPVDGLLVLGARARMEPVLLGKQTGGRPSADFLSLTSGRGDTLLYIYVDLVATRGGRGDFGFLASMDYPEDDPATHLLLRVRAVGKDDDQHLHLEGVVRHRLGKRGLEATEVAGRKWLEELAQHPRLIALKKTWDEVKITREGPDLVARLDLGRPRDAAGKLAVLGAVIFAPMTEARAAQERAQAAEAAEKARAEAAKKVDEKPKD
jgi:hypothetical protein